MNGDFSFNDDFDPDESFESDDRKALDSKKKAILKAKAGPIKRRRHGGSQPLIDTGTMRASVSFEIEK